MNWLRWLFGRSQGDAVSRQWLSEQNHRESRIEFHGVRIAWPIRKSVNESALFNRYKLKRRA